MCLGNEQILHRRRSTSNQQIYKKSSTSLVIREMQIKTTLSSSHPNQNGDYQEYKQQQVLMRMVKEGTLIHCWQGCKLVQPLWKAVWRFLRELGMEPPFDPAIPLLGLYPKDLISAYYRDTATSMFIAAPCTIVRLWNQPRCPSVDEWIKKLWHIYIQWNITLP